MDPTQTLTETGIIGVVAAALVQYTKSKTGASGAAVRVGACALTMAASIAYAYAAEGHDAATLTNGAYRGVMAWMVAAGLWGNTRPVKAAAQ